MTQLLNEDSRQGKIREKAMIDQLKRDRKNDVDLHLHQATNTELNLKFKTMDLKVEAALKRKEDQLAARVAKNAKHHETIKKQKENVNRKNHEELVSTVRGLEQKDQ